MPRQGQFFQQPPNLQKVIEVVKSYQKEIDNQQERKEKLEELLKDKLSSACRKRAYKQVQSLKAEIDHHQDELAKVIKSNPDLQAYFTKRL